MAWVLTLGVVVEESSAAVPRDAVPLAAAIGAVREEFAHAWWDGPNKWLRFKPSPVELTLQVAVDVRGQRQRRDQVVADRAGW